MTVKLDKAVIVLSLFRLIIFARPIAIAIEGPTYKHNLCMLNASYKYHVYYTYIKRLYWLKLHTVT